MGHEYQESGINHELYQVMCTECQQMKTQREATFSDEVSIINLRSGP